MAPKIRITLLLRGLRYRPAADDANALLKIFVLFALKSWRTLDQPELKQNFQREGHKDFEEGSAK
jgi:hypothetical protein